MESLIRAIKELLEVLERMAGGKKWARIVFWVGAIVLLALAARPAWDSADYVVTKLSFASPLVTALASVVLLVVGFGVLFAVVT
ncbi:MAG: hypothetical protein HY662_03900, partial [Chloroflexi bacterium]|nr:hypothetical protein [Chloroflexota bacterium]